MTNTICIRPRIAFALIGAALLACTGMGASNSASAQQTYPPEVESQCTNDYFTHCSSYALGSTALRRCMEAKGQDLSSNCKQALVDAGYVKASRVRRSRNQ
jgi:hypothetical protein